MRTRLHHENARRYINNPRTDTKGTEDAQQQKKYYQVGEFDAHAAITCNQFDVHAAITCNQFDVYAAITCNQFDVHATITCNQFDMHTTITSSNARRFNRKAKNKMDYKINKISKI